jgi:diguanylate cyclase (GGDEF)-like protein
MLLGNSLLAGLLGGAGYLLSRVIRLKLKGIRLIHLHDSLNVALPVTVAGWLLMEAGRGLKADSLLWLPYLFLAMAAFNLMNLAGFVIDRWAVGTPPSLKMIGRYLVQISAWMLLSLPFVYLVLVEILEGSLLRIVFSSLPLLVMLWALHLNAGLREKNLALIQASRRQEFLQQLTLTSAGSLENESFLQDLLRGLREFVPWDRELLLILPTPGLDQALMHSLGELPTDPHGVKESLRGLLESASLRTPRLSAGKGLRPMLDPESKSQVLVALATSQMAFGVLVAERKSGESFKEEEVKFLELAFSQIAQHVQDEILKKQLMLTNRKLLHQTDYLSQILQISNLLKVHLDVQGILEKVALGIRDGIGFRTVLISLYHEAEGYFERLAQAGLEERWQEIRTARPPAEDILSLLRPRFRVGNCYYMRKGDVPPLPYSIMPQNVKEAQEPDDWDPMDILLVPLYDKDDRLLGIISVDEPVDGKVPSMETLRALEVLANQTVHALESAQVHAHIKRQAVMDGLTGLYNHGYFQETLALKTRELAEGRRSYTILMMDLDNFKEINDTYGHLVGDEVLKAVAGALTASIRREDVAARYGGEEFAVLLPDRTLEQSLPVAERIRAGVENIRVPLPQSSSARPIRVTLSVGLASYPEQGEDHHQVLQRADTALYQAKRAGKNRVSPAQ